MTTDSNLDKSPARSRRDVAIDAALDAFITIGTAALLFGIGFGAVRFIMGAV